VTRSLLHRYLGDRRFLLTLPRAVTLQMLHPQVSAAVRDHVHVRLWDHKKRVVSQMIYMEYGRQDASPVILAGHEHVKGIDLTGRRYHGLRPELFLFQHATYVDTLVTSINTFVEPLSLADHERLYDECCLWYEGYGVSTRSVPASWAEFVDYFTEACNSQLLLTPDNAALVDEALHPDTWVPARAPSFVTRGIQHPRAAALLGITQNWAQRQAFSTYAHTLRAALAAAPVQIRYVQQAR